MWHRPYDFPHNELGPLTGRGDGNGTGSCIDIGIDLGRREAQVVDLTSSPLAGASSHQLGNSLP